MDDEELAFVLTRRWRELGLDLDQADFTNAHAVAAMVRITGGNFRLVQRLFVQIERILGNACGSGFSGLLAARAHRLLDRLDLGRGLADEITECASDRSRSALRVLGIGDCKEQSAAFHLDLAEHRRLLRISAKILADLLSQSRTIPYLFQFIHMMHEIAYRDLSDYRSRKSLI